MGAKNKFLLERAMALGSKPWNRSKVMLVGEGRVGKTALCNSMTGKPFVETESTSGFTCQVFDVKSSAVANHKRWTSHENPAREYEAGLAQMMKETSLKVDSALKPKNKEVKAMDYYIEEKEEKKNENYDGQRKVSKKIMDPIYSSEVKSADDTINISDDIKVMEALPENLIAFINMSEKHVDAQEQPHINSGVVNENILLKCLADNIMTSNNIILSLCDFGGQHVFNIIHNLFFTSFGVYVVVFQMVDILDDKKMDQSLNELSFWINSVVMHTLNCKAGKTAPVFLVGTHKDIVSSPSEHERISNLIYDRINFISPRNILADHSYKFIDVVCVNLIKNNALCFFPVDNKAGQLDEVIVDLMIRIENVLKDADYVNAPRPLTWLKALDELVATKRSFRTLGDATSIALENGVEKDAVLTFLSFLNEMGVVLWIDKPKLRNVVILDIMSFFVAPATRLICNHVAQPSDITIHHKKMQQFISERFPIEWNRMISKGIVGRRLIDEMFSYEMDGTNNYIIPDNISLIIDLMIQFDLIVRLEHEQFKPMRLQSKLNTYSPEMYMVPALLPDAIEYAGNMSLNSCYFAFSIDAQFPTRRWVNKAMLFSCCYLPPASYMPCCNVESIDEKCFDR